MLVLNLFLHLGSVEYSSSPPQTAQSIPPLAFVRDFLTEIATPVQIVS